jgi:predicted hydrolase (HD superfamily)
VGRSSPAGTAPAPSPGEPIALVAGSTPVLVAAALVRPERSAGMKVSRVEKKLKERSFAPGVNRDEVNDVEASLVLPLD